MDRPLLIDMAFALRDAAGSAEEAATNVGLFINDLAAQLGALVHARELYSGSGYGTALWHFSAGYNRAEGAAATWMTPEQIEAAEIRFAREAKGMTQVDLSAQVKIKNWQISNWEKAKHDATEAERARMGAALGIALPDPHKRQGCQ